MSNLKEISRRALTGIGKTSLISEVESNRSIWMYLTLFDSMISCSDLTKRLNENLLLFDRFKSRVSSDSQYFERIHNFNCAECIIEKTISGDDVSNYTSIDEFLEETMSFYANKPFLMNKNKPYWRLHLFQFKSLNQTAIIFRCHHCICDGVSFVEIWYRLTDGYKPRNINNDSSSKTKTKSKSIWYKILTILLWIYGMLIVLYRTFIFMVTSEPKTIFKNKLSEKKQISFITNDISLDKLNKIRKSDKFKKIKPTFNDFILVCIAESITLYLQNNNLFIPKYIHLAMPVNIRDRSKALNNDMLGNKIGSYIIKLPLDKNMDFMDKLKKIKAELVLVKKTPEAMIGFYVMKAVSMLPLKIANIIAPTFSGGFTVVSSVLRGLSDVYICSAKAKYGIAVVPPPMGVALGYAVLTQDGKVVVTVNVDQNCYDQNTSKDLLKCFKTVLKQQNCL